MKKKLFYQKILFIMIFICCSSLAQKKSKYNRSVNVYQIPDITLIDQNNQKVVLRELVNKKKILIVDFIYTKCRTVCPVLSSNIVNFQQKMKNESEKFEIISITIDPEYDSVEIIKNYLQRFHSLPGWNILTGQSEKIYKLMNVFSSYTKQKMGFYPIIFVFNPENKKWIQIEGPITTSELIDEYRLITKGIH